MDDYVDMDPVGDDVPTPCPCQLTRPVPYTRNRFTPYACPHRDDTVYNAGREREEAVAVAERLHRRESEEAADGPNPYGENWSRADPVDAGWTAPPRRSTMNAETAKRLGGTLTTPCFSGNGTPFPCPSCRQMVRFKKTVHSLNPKIPFKKWDEAKGEMVIDKICMPCEQLSLIHI